MNKGSINLLSQKAYFILMYFFSICFLKSENVKSIGPLFKQTAFFLDQF